MSKDSSDLFGALFEAAPVNSTMSRTVLQRGIDGDAQPPRGAGATPFMGDYLGIDSSGSSLVAVAWTGNGPLSQDAWAATLGRVEQAREQIATWLSSPSD